MEQDTIIAISTALGRGAIGIIRLSGGDAISIVENFFSAKYGPKDLEVVKSHTVHFGYIFDHNKKLDEVLVTIMKAPHTYTGEHVVEISCHNNEIILNKILELGQQFGARLARPGEFTERAFLNDRMDLVQAEAVSDVISADNHFAEELAFRQLRGELSSVFKDWRERILDIITLVEVSIDHQDIFDPNSEELAQKLDELYKKIDKSISVSKDTRRIYEGLTITLAGRPNAGKSSLLNAVLKKEHAIVSHIEGTTRDAVTGSIEYKNIKMTFIDTAGLREENEFSKNIELEDFVNIEKLGIEKTKIYMSSSEYVVFIVDANRGLTDHDLRLLEDINDTQYIIIAFNKIDLSSAKPVDLEKINILHKNILANIYLSAKNLINVDEILDVIAKHSTRNVEASNENIMVNNRHIALVNETKIHLNNSIMLIKNNEPLEIFAVELNLALRPLNEILGIDINEEILDRIFSKFCIGK